MSSDLVKSSPQPKKRRGRPPMLAALKTNPGCKSDVIDDAKVAPLLQRRLGARRAPKLQIATKKRETKPTMKRSLKYY